MEPATGMATMMKIDFEKNRIEARDRAVAMSVASDMMDRFFDPDAVKDMRDVRRMMGYAVEMAAYTAIQKERELHLGDMAALRSWMEARHFEMTKPVSVRTPQ